MEPHSTGPWRLRIAKCSTTRQGGWWWGAMGLTGQERFPAVGVGHRPYNPSIFAFQLLGGRLPRLWCNEHMRFVGPQPSSGRSSLCIFFPVSSDHCLPFSHATKQAYRAESQLTEGTRTLPAVSPVEQWVLGSDSATTLLNAPLPSVSKRASFPLRLRSWIVP